MSKKLWALVLLVAMASLAYADTAITGTIKYPDGTGINGRLEMKLIRSGVRDNCNGGQVVPTTAVTMSIVGGSIVNATRTNLLAQSQTIEQSPWASTSFGGAPAGTSLANQDTAPDGTVTADSVSLPANGGVGQSGWGQITANGLITGQLVGRTYAASVWLRAAAPVSVSFQLQDTTDSAHGGGGTYNITTTWTRFTTIFTFPGTATGNRIGFHLRNSTNAQKDFFVWGAQLEEAPAVTNYITTTSAALTVYAKNFVSSDCMSPPSVYQIRVYDDLNHTIPMTDNWYLQGNPMDVGTIVSVFGLPSPFSVPNPVVQTPTLAQTILVPNGTTTTVQAGVAGVIPLTVKAASGQTANMQTWISNAGAVLASINSAGAFTGTFSGNITWSQLTSFPATCTNQFLRALATSPTCNAVSLTADVSGILPRANGGTAQNSTAVFPTSGNVLTDVNTFALSNKTFTGAASGNSVNLLNAQGPLGAVTGTGADATIYTFTVPANTVQAGKCVGFFALWKHSTGTANVVYKVKLGSTTLNTSGGVNDSSFDSSYTGTICNAAGVQNSQYMGALSNFGISTTQTFSLDGTSVENFANALAFSMTMTVAATDQVTPKAFYMWLIQ